MSDDRIESAVLRVRNRLATGGYGACAELAAATLSHAPAEATATASATAALRTAQIQAAIGAGADAVLRVAHERVDAAAVGPDAAAALTAWRAVAQVLADTPVTASLPSLDSAASVPAAAAAAWATVAYLQGDEAAAWTLAHAHPKHLECVSIAIHLLLLRNRLDRATALVDASRSLFDDATAAQLFETWTQLVAGRRETLRDASYVYDELVASNVASPKLLTGKALCRLLAGDRMAAASILRDARRELMGPSMAAREEADLLANAAAVALIAGHPDAETLEAEGQRVVPDEASALQYEQMLRQREPTHPYIADLDAKSNAFDRLADRFAAAIPV
ncbi:hypothetical protein CXG81DRAFT_17272 [Caulochytrium protostelioides]|uniref:Coatomer subunit epsilon n=1 Tax=Caulochytrium protostelioides TaxID=1555241 RepID=A0A4P9XCE9_9FUNG|nr:hypothetical protein CXG81DRAFT_17272 [Caulochytrium protostelioides]|eukprot:RKP03106.1 hypothetical protein CXG81DRAFT_17272 [Caulochytrium protostelioides]